MGNDPRSRWEHRYRTEAAPNRPSPYVLRQAERLPTSGRALDVAGGAGRPAVVLAQHGLDVTLVDISPAALELAAATAAGAGVALQLVAADLDVEPLPEGPWHVVLCFHYLQRSLFPQILARLTPGGTLITAIATVRNLERHERPPAQYLLAPGELPRLVAGLDIVDYQEGWLDEDRHEARLVARKRV